MIDTYVQFVGETEFKPLGKMSVSDISAFRAMFEMKRVCKGVHIKPKADPPVEAPYRCYGITTAELVVPQNRNSPPYMLFVCDYITDTGE
jgi:hypothetical protein